MIKNSKQRRHPRQGHRYTTIAPVPRPVLNPTVKFTDIPFPPLLKRHSRGIEPIPEPAERTYSPKIARKNSIYQLRVSENIRQSALGRIIKEHRSLDRSNLDEMSLHMEEYFRDRVTNLLGKKRHIILPNRVGLPVENKTLRTVYRRQSIRMDCEDMQETLLEQKELTIRKKFIQTTMNSISYERDRMRRDRQSHSYRCSQPSQRVVVQRQAHSTMLNREYDFPQEPQRNNVDSPRRKPHLPQYDMSSNSVQLRPWTNQNNQQ